jgi:hypothetical protein
MEDETVFSSDPAAMAQKWAMAGAELIHVVDLDGAFENSPQNIDAIKNILKTVNTPIQLGGGIRTERTIRMFFQVKSSSVLMPAKGVLPLKGGPKPLISRPLIWPNDFKIAVLPLLTLPIFTGMECKRGLTSKRLDNSQKQFGFLLLPPVVSLPSKTFRIFCLWQLPGSLGS